MPERARRALTGIEVEELFEYDPKVGKVPVGVLRKVKFTNKKAALDVLAQYLGIIKNRFNFDPADGGGGSLTIIQLLKQILLPEGTTRQWQAAEAIDVASTPVGDARPDLGKDLGASRSVH
jgi:hypothetical protein